MAGRSVANLARLAKRASAKLVVREIGMDELRAVHHNKSASVAGRPA